MADARRARLILIVTGSTLRAEEVDRPLGYYLQQQVERQLAAGPEPGGFRVLVIADFRWLNDEPLQALPTISLGGPGVNALARRWLEDLPVSLALDDQYYIQMDPELDELRASVWGMNNTATQIAVSAFVQRYLPQFLDRCRSHAPEPPEPEPTDPDAADSDSDEPDSDEVD
jgi:hypothetical protein